MIPNVRWDKTTLEGPEESQAQVYRICTINALQSTPKKFLEFGMSPSRGVLLYAPPPRYSTGKMLWKKQSLMNVPGNII